MGYNCKKKTYIKGKTFGNHKPFLCMVEHHIMLYIERENGTLMGIIFKCMDNVAMHSFWHYF